MNIDNLNLLEYDFDSPALESIGEWLASVKDKISAWWTHFMMGICRRVNEWADAVDAKLTLAIVEDRKISGMLWRLLYRILITIESICQHLAGSCDRQLSMDNTRKEILRDAALSESTVLPLTGSDAITIPEKLNVGLLGLVNTLNTKGPVSNAIVRNNTMLLDTVGDDILKADAILPSAKDQIRLSPDVIRVSSRSMTKSCRSAAKTMIGRSRTALERIDRSAESSGDTHQTAKQVVDTLDAYGNVLPSMIKAGNATMAILTKNSTPVH